MLDIKRIRENPKELEEALAKRHSSIHVDTLLDLDERRRALIGQVEQLKGQRNQLSSQVARLKRNHEDATEPLEASKKLGETIKALDDEVRSVEGQMELFLLSTPNIPHPSVPEGASDAENVEVRRWGEPTTFDFEPKPHWDLAEALDIMDFQRGAKVSGTRFTFLKGMGARLERSVINFFLNEHTRQGYTEVFPPFMVHRRSMQGTGQLPKFEEDAFKVMNSEYFLIPTAEVPVTNMYREEILDGDRLPIKHCAYSACFRSEAGSAGRDTRGYIRQHQFNKVEMVRFCKPEESYDQLEELVGDAERMLQLLGLPYRVVVLCTGDLTFSSAKTYDLEVWMPSYNRYVEISSCSNFEDYQARRAQIRFRSAPKAKPELVHTLNGSGLAAGRTVAAILENYQQADGTIAVPEALRPYMGVDVIRPD